MPVSPQWRRIVRAAVPFPSIVNNGQVEIWGFAGSPDEARAIGLLAEDVPGVRGVVNNVRVGEHAKYLF